MERDKSLATILNTSSKAKIIRLFTLGKGDFKASGRSVARLVGISAPAAHAALKELQREGVVKREIIGGQHIYSLDGNSIVVKQLLKPMFQKENSIKQETEYSQKQSRNKNVYIIAGSNGAGKTTFAKEFLPDYAECRHFINSDLIAQGLSPFSPRIAAMKAGRLVLEQIDDMVNKGMDFGFETTLAGKLYVNRLKDLKSRGYTLHIFFLWIPSVELAIARIKDRVAFGGHAVPAQDVRRRFARGIHNFFNFYKGLADSWMLLDNSSTAPSIIAKGKNDQLTIVNEELFKKIAKTAE